MGSISASGRNKLILWEIEKTTQMQAEKGRLGSHSQAGRAW